ncbi:MAG: site-specific DNA-methyltransferase, partial [Chloroflexota bacterium]
MPPRNQNAPISHTQHQDKRANIPTEELRDFVADDEQSPTSLLYPRDPSLDPQLVWRGKDEQDAQDLVVPAVPIYIQEKIHPQVLIDDLLAHAAHPGHRLAEEEAAYQLNMFADFNGGPEEFEQKVEFYQHEQNWTNRLILGDSLLVMASLAEKEGLRGKVQTIYLDPPYGIKFGSNWQVSTRKRDVKDGKAEDATRQPEQVRAFRDTWKLGIHSYLAYLRDRLVVARELLTETGSVFVQIGDENVHLVRNLLDEVFGSENYVAIIPFRKKTMPLGAKYLEGMFDYLIWYAKGSGKIKYRQLYLEQDTTGDFHWGWFESPNAKRQKMSQEQVQNLTLLPPDVRIFRLVPLWPASFSLKDVYPIKFRGETYNPPKGLCWVTGETGINRLIWANRIEPEGTGNLRYIYFFDDYPLKKLVSMWDDTTGARDQRYVVETTTKVIERCMLMTTDPGDLVLDPTCGSGTTAYVAEQWGRRWITCDTSRVALALARTRLMSAKYPYYLLSDS